MRLLTRFALLVVALAGSAAAIAQDPDPTNPIPLPIPPRYILWKSHEGSSWKWQFAAFANDDSLADRKKELEDAGHSMVDCGRAPPDMRKVYTVCGYETCPDNGCPYSDGNCPTPRPVMMYVLPPVCQPCPPASCVPVCQPVQRERPRLFPIFRRCR
jgi:hypothetical protein